MRSEKITFKAFFTLFFSPKESVGGSIGLWENWVKLNDMIK